MSLAVEHKKSWSNTVLSTIGLGLSDLLLKFHFLFCNPQLLISLGSIWCVLKTGKSSCGVMSQLDTSLLCFALTSLFLGLMLVVLLLLLILEVQWYNICLKLFTCVSAFLL